MDFFIGSVYVFFVMGIECFIVLYIVFDGSLYYIECWGFGGGLEIDNISIVNGVFWKVFYIGSGVLFVVVQFQLVLWVVGEIVYFFCIVFGVFIFFYQW